MSVERPGELPPAVRAKAALLRQRAAAGSMWLPVDGNSMGRSIGAGSEVLIAAAKRPRIGEIWAFCNADGQLVVHRHRGNTRDRRVFQGDAGQEPDDPVRDEQLVGRAVAVRDAADDGEVRRLGVRERIRGWSLRSRRWSRRRATSGVGAVDDAAVVGADERRGDGLTAHDAGANVGNSGIGHGAASMSRDRAVMVTADAVVRGCTVDLLGLAMRLEAGEPRAAEAVVSVLGGARATSAVARVRLTATVCAPGVPSSAPDRSTAEFDTWRPAPGEVVLRHRSGLTARATSSTIEIGGDAENFDACFRRVCLNALAHLLTQHDQFVVHGAAIVTGGRAILVLGGTGAGKSTIAFCALRAGWDVLADDLVVLRSSDSGPTVGGVPRPLAIPSELLGDNQVDTVALMGDRRDRRELPSDAIALGSYPIAGSILVHHADEALGTIGPIGAHALLHDLLAAWAPVETPAVLRELLPIAATIARGKALTLCLGREPATRVADTIRLLDAVRSQFGLS